MSENNATESNSGTVGGSSVLRASFLRPSVLGSAVNHSNTAFELNPSLLDGKAKLEVSTTSSNPFLKEQGEDNDSDEKNNEENDGTTTTTKPVDNTDGDKDKKCEDDEIDERPDPLTMLRKNGMERANIFAAAKTSIEKSGFVFGQNVHERVVGENVKPDSDSKPETANSKSEELLFSSVIKNAATKASDGVEPSSNSDAETKEAETKSLNDVAREYEESRAQKRKFEEVETFTGEENEVNITDINCKLFAFVNSNWEERGRGSLRLNDSKNEHECSRVVFRTAGNLRLLLNTKVWAGMVAERPSQKSLRLTAMDNTGKIKLFLAQARPIDINQLHKALVERIDARKKSHPDESCAEINSAADGENGSIQKNGAADISADPRPITLLESSTSTDAESNKDGDSNVEPEHEDKPSPPKKAAVSVDE